MADPVKDLLEKAAKRAERVALMDTCPGKDDEEETRTFTPNCLLISFGFGRNDPAKNADVGNILTSKSFGYCDKNNISVSINSIFSRVVITKKQHERITDLGQFPEYP